MPRYVITTGASLGFMADDETVVFRSPAFPRIDAFVDINHRRTTVPAAQKPGEEVREQHATVSTPANPAAVKRLLEQSELGLADDARKVGWYRLANWHSLTVD